jgi:hypothetical protein
MSDFETQPTDFLETSTVEGLVGDEYFSHVKKINDIFYDQIKISDQKAAYIFTFMLAFLISSSEGRNVFTLNRYMEGDIAAIAVSAALAVASVFSILSAILVVLPRSIPRSTSLFWGAWPKHRLLLLEAARRADASYLFNQYLENADILSLIARKKYRFVSFAFRGLVVTVVSYVLLLSVT